MKIIKVAYWVKNSFGTHETTDFVTELVYGSLNPYLNFTMLEIRELSDICADVKQSEYCLNSILEKPKKHIKAIDGKKCFDVTPTHYPKFWLNSDHCISKSVMKKRIEQDRKWVDSQPTDSRKSYSSLFKNIV